MKFLHLSDLHLGKRVHNFSMIDDQRYILEQILDIVRFYASFGICGNGRVVLLEYETKHKEGELG